MNFNETVKFTEEILKRKNRLSGENLFDHSQKVATKLRKYGIKEEATLKLVFIQKALEEANPTEKEQLKKCIDSEMQTLLEKYRKFAGTKIKTEALKNFNEKYLMQTCINLVEDVRPLAVRITEKLTDLENCWMFEKRKREDIAYRALYLYAPLAKILGINALSKDLEDAAFKVLFPMEYFTLKKFITKKTRGVKSTFNEIEKFLNEILREQGLAEFQISYRIKGIYSVYKKLLRYKNARMENFSEEDLNKIYDLIALRIVVLTTEECYIVENLLQQLWENIPSERDDYIKEPRTTGYEAIHNVFHINKDLIAEVQIKTLEMHQKAEFGISSHLLYKIGDKGQKSQAVGEFKKYLKKHPEWFKDLNFWELQKKKGYIPSTPFSNKEYVLTPKGDIVELPVGATVIDFAYAVHSEIGDKCVGAFVNNKIVKLNHVVKTGDIVRIKVSGQRKKPSEDWLKFVKTRRARTRITQKVGGKTIDKI
ncbi:MAG TPA: TGS domain-containing protein [bacterium]|nr:TGS domain-containing protein [bacterium]